jgi:carbamoyltransferase
VTTAGEILIARFRERRGTDKTHFQKILPGSEKFRNQPECPALTAILGISAFYHDSAAALVVDGQLIAAAQEERFTRKKHDEGFPQQAVDFCLAQGNITPEQIDYVAFYDKPLRKFERLLETYLAYAPAGYRSFRKAMPVWLQQKLYMPREIRTGLRDRYRGRFVFTEHHESHAASAFFPSPFEDAAILTMDGVGEWSTTAMGVGRGNQIELTHEIRFPHSLGLLYSAFTYYTGFKVNSGEYKLMGLAPYGEPKFRDLILNNLLVLKEDGSFQMDMSYFNYCQGLTMTSEKLHRLFGAPPRKPESLLTQREMDLAASIQSVTEEVMLRMARHVRKTSGSKNLVLAGGVALNCVGNGKILREGIFDNVWIQPASGDAGGALGAAMFVWHQLLEKPRKTQQPDAQRGSFLGPCFSNDEIAASSVGFRGAWNLVLARWEVAAFWAMHEVLECSR